jgi:hypothetical protein
VGHKSGVQASENAGLADWQTRFDNSKGQVSSEKRWRIDESSG